MLKKELEAKIYELETKLSKIEEIHTDLYIYLNNDKFNVDTTVNKSDIFLRLRERLFTEV